MPTATLYNRPEDWRAKVARAAANRQADAGRRSTDMIRVVVDRVGYDALAPRLAQVARLRLDNPQVHALAALAKLADPPITRDTLQNSLTKLHRIARDLPDPL